MTTKSNLAAHAERELALLGQTTEDPGFAASIIATVEAFASYSHSGGSAMIARAMVAKLLAFENLAPITTDPAEWNDVSEASGSPMWQNLRNSALISVDAGATYWHVDSKDQVMVTGQETAPEAFYRGRLHNLEACVGFLALLAEGSGRFELGRVRNGSGESLDDHWRVYLDDGNGAQTEGTFGPGSAVADIAEALGHYRTP
jgi:hypothetical protein